MIDKYIIKSMCKYYQMHSWEHVQQVGEHATPKQKVLVADNFPLRWSAGSQWAISHGLNSNSKSLGSPSAAWISSSLEGLRCLLNTWPFSIEKVHPSLTWYTQISPNISPNTYPVTLQFSFRYPHLYNQQPEQHPKQVVDFFFRGIEKKTAMVKTAGPRRLRFACGAPVRSYVNRDHLQFFHFIGRVVGKVHGITTIGEVMNSLSGRYLSFSKHKW